MNLTVTSDTIFDGRLTCLQHKNGYRFSVDAVLLAHFFSPHDNDHILDLGAGCGVISLILAYRWSAVHLTCLEIQKNLFKLLSRNCATTFAERMTCVAGDLCAISDLFAANTFDCVVCNPPYYEIGSGMINPDEEQAIAKHEVKARLSDIVSAAHFALRDKGRAFFVYPVERAKDLLTCLRGGNLEPKRMQTVHAYPGADGILVLLEAVKNGGKKLNTLPPIFIYDEKGGTYSEVMQGFYRC